MVVAELLLAVLPLLVAVVVLVLLVLMALRLLQEMVAEVRHHLSQEHQ